MWDNVRKIRNSFLFPCPLVQACVLEVRVQRCGQYTIQDRYQTRSFQWPCLTWVQLLLLWQAWGISEWVWYLDRALSFAWHYSLLLLFCPTLQRCKRLMPGKRNISPPLSFSIFPWKHTSQAFFQEQVWERNWRVSHMIDTVSTGHLAVGKKHYLSRGIRTEETPVDRNTCPTFSLQTNSGTERVTCPTVKPAGIFAGP